MKKVLAGAGVLAACGVVYAATALTVDQSLTDSDLRAIDSLGVEAECANAHVSYDSQIACVTAIQSRVLAIGEGYCAPRGAQVEPMDFIIRGYGCCHDRSRFIEKAARRFGFETRHVFFIDAGDNVLRSLVTPGRTSHAASEIRTSKGWIGVDSVSSLVLEDEQSRPWTFEAAIRTGMFRDHERQWILYHYDWRIILGLYSRHGRFHGPNLPGPEFVLTEFVQNF